MATLETLRNKAGVFVAVIIGLALLSFILSDLLGSGRSIFSADDMEVGRVDGTSISYPVFQQQADQQLQLLQAMQGNQGNSEMLGQQVREQIWQRFVRQQVLDRECDRLGLAFTNEELSGYILGNEVHPVVKQLFTNPQTGEFSRDQLVNFLQNLDEGVSPEQKAYWLEVERELRDELAMKKYVTLVTKGLGVTKFENDFRAGLLSNSVDAAYVYKSYDSQPDSLFKVTEAQAKSYYQENRERFKQGELRDLAYVTFPLTPAEYDFQMAREALEKLIPEFSETADPGAYATQNGDTPYTDRWESPKNLPAGLATWAEENTPEGAVSGVELAGNEYLVGRLVARKALPDSAHAQHILFSYQKYPQERAKELADSILNLVKSGANFAELASQYSDDPGSKEKGGDLGWFAQGVMVPPFNDACFLGKRGDRVVVESQFGVHIVEVLGQKGSSEMVKVAILSQKVEAGNQTYQQVFNQASSFATEVHVARPNWVASLFGAGKDRVVKAENLFDSVAQARSIQKRIANKVEGNLTRVGALENSREMVRWAFEAKPGDVSKVFELGNEFAVALLVRIAPSKDGYATFEAVKSEAQQGALQELKRAALLKQFEAQGTSVDVQALASALGESVKRAQGVTFNGYSFGSEGYEPAAVGVGSSLAVSQLANGVAGNTGVFAIVAEEVHANPTAQEDDIASRQSDLRKRAEYETYESLKSMATIVDRRARFF